MVVDIALFGENWSEEAQQFQQINPEIQILYTSNVEKNLSQGEAGLFNRWNVIQKPFSPYNIKLMLMNEWVEANGLAPEQEVPAKVRLPIRAKITLPYILLALFLALAATYIVTRLVFETIEERFINQLMETGLISAEWMVKEEDRLLETLRIIVNTKGIAEAILEGDSELLRELAFPVAVNSLEEAVEILDTSGTSLLSMHHREGGNIEEYEFTSGDNLYGGWDFVQKVMSQQADAIGDKYSGFEGAPWGDFFYVSGPIVDQNNQVIGVILIGKSLPTLAQQIREATLAQVSLYDDVGKPLATTFLEAETLDEEVARNILARQDDDSYRRDLNITNIDYSELLGPLEARYDVDLGLMGVALPQNLFVQLTQTSRWQIMIIVAIALMTVITVGILVSDSITRPLLQVVRATSEVARGNMRIKLEPTSNDEISTLARTFNHMITELDRSNYELLEAYDSSLEGWSRALELRDYDTDEHSRRVVIMAMRMAVDLGIPDEELIHVRRGAMLHDIGKMGVPDSILLKPGKLTEEEWEVMRRHPVFAYEMLRPIKYLRPAIDIPYCHHEKWDGSGYPNGLKGEDIPLSARIFSIVDVWDALTSDRPYRKAWSNEKTIEFIHSQRNIHFDPIVVDALVSILIEEERI
jgi:HD-GYP domain-containing protein (c-di-GMP phosphodiesterase class II)